MSDDPMNEARAATNAGFDSAKSMGKTMNDMGASIMSEFTKLFSDMKPPIMPNVDSLMAAHRRNLETLSAANRVALEGAQAIARRNMEIMQQTMAELTDGMRQLTTAEPTQARAAKQVEMMKTSYERAVANMHEISDLIQRSNGEALGLLNKRFAEAMDEVKSLSAKS